MTRSASPSFAANFALTALRVVAAVMFLQSGTTKIFSWPVGVPEGTVIETFSQIWIGGCLEIVCGALLAVGLLTRISAFLMSGMMAVAYFQFHAKSGFWPAENGGLAAVLYCFLWLYFAAAGAGPWSLDAMRSSRR